MKSTLPLCGLLCVALAACTQSDAPSQASVDPVTGAATTAPATAPAAATPAEATVPVTAPTTTADAATGSAAVAASASAPAVAAAGALPTVVVYKSPSCGCCIKWVDHMRANGFQVELRDQDDVVPTKKRLGVPLDKASCHTAEVGGYFVEGHVPAQDVKRLLAEKPKARGLVLAGMPMGSPGMEVPDGTVQPYTVELVQADGKAVAYAEHGPTAR